MEIYKSQNICINQRSNMLIQQWTSNKLSVDDFRKELKTFLSFYEKIKPKSVLWLQENFRLEIPPSLYNWIENDIVKKQYESGMTNLGFTVSADMLSHLSVMASFEKVKSVVQPNFFTDRNMAINFLDREVKKKSNLIYKVQKQDKRSKIEIELDNKLLPKVVSTLEKIEKEQKYIDDNLSKIKSLSHREMEIFRLIVNGYSSKEISTKLYIETSTIGSHRKNIIKKLNIKRPLDWFICAKAFDLLDSNF